MGMKTYRLFTDVGCVGKALPQACNAGESSMMTFSMPGLLTGETQGLVILQAANPELSMAQIQQLTAMAFARDDHEQAPQPPAPAPASHSDASHNDGPSDTGPNLAQGDPTQSPGVPRSGQGSASGRTVSGASSGAARPAGSGAAAAAVDFAHARSDGSEWASGFIAEARQQNAANSDAVSSLSGGFMSCYILPLLHAQCCIVVASMASSCHSCGYP